MSLDLRRKFLLALFFGNYERNVFIRKINTRHILYILYTYVAINSRRPLAGLRSRFSSVRRGCTRITLNVTRLSGAHAASKLSPVYNCAACAGIRARSFCRSGDAGEISVVHRGALYDAAAPIYEIAVHLYCRLRARSSLALIIKT